MLQAAHVSSTNNWERRGDREGRGLGDWEGRGWGDWEGWGDGEIGKGWGDREGDRVGR